MKHVLEMAVAILVLAGSTALAGLPAWLPDGVYFRIDKHKPTPQASKGVWEQVSFQEGENGDWGQGQCQSGGTECHLNDWITWWEAGQAVPATNTPTYEQVEYGNTSYFPSGYNAYTGRYVY